VGLMKRSLRFLLLSFPAFLCMAVIFHLSAQTAAVSDSTSAGFIDWALTAFFAKFKYLSEAAQAQAVASCQFIVRKAAHFSLYALLGILWYAPMYSWTNGAKKSACLSWMATALYAVSDEIHQKFVPGRSGELRDVLIDSAGAAVGILLVYVIVKIILRKRTTNKKMP